MKRENLILTRKFGKISPCQREHTVTYRVEQMDRGAQMRLVGAWAEDTVCHVLRLPEIPYNMAVKLTRFLYDNSIEPDSALDILTDMQVGYCEMLQ